MIHHFKFRPYKINVTSFKQDLLNSDLIANPKTNVTDLYNQYHSVLSDLVNHHAPIRSMTKSVRPTSPWITSDILQPSEKKGDWNVHGGESYCRTDVGFPNKCIGATIKFQNPKGIGTQT